MGKIYEKINFRLGSSVEEAVNELLNYKDNGHLVSGNFNGVTLYSDTVTMDSAYLEITGNNKKDFDEYVSKLL